MPPPSSRARQKSKLDFEPRLLGRAFRARRYDESLRRGTNVVEGIASNEAQRRTSRIGQRVGCLAIYNFRGLHSKFIISRGRTENNQIARFHLAQAAEIRVAMRRQRRISILSRLRRARNMPHGFPDRKHVV